MQVELIPYLDVINIRHREQKTAAQYGTNRVGAMATYIEVVINDPNFNLTFSNSVYDKMKMLDNKT